MGRLLSMDFDALIRKNEELRLLSKRGSYSGRVFGTSSIFVKTAVALFSRTLSVVSTIFMIWMLIDCARNQSVKNKGAWIVFSLFTQLIGSIVYFFARGPWPKSQVNALFSAVFPGLSNGICASVDAKGNVFRL
jgi:Phospholipase_D-nuclease N-terminal